MTIEPGLIDSWMPIDLPSWLILTPRVKDPSGGSHAHAFDVTACSHATEHAWNHRPPEKPCLKGCQAHNLVTQCVMGIW